MKKTALVLAFIMILCCLSGCNNDKKENKNTESQCSSEPLVGMPNPMEKTTAKGIMDTLGLAFKEPQNATKITYYTISKKIAEMNFVRNGISFCERIEDTNKMEDISGLYYKWDSVTETTVQNRAAKVMRQNKTPETEAVCLWYDAVTGLTYSLSASADNLSGLDIRAVAEEIYLPMQGDVG